MGDEDRLTRTLGTRLEVRTGRSTSFVLVFFSGGEIGVGEGGVRARNSITGLADTDSVDENSRYGESGGCSRSIFTPLGDVGETGDVSGSCSTIRLGEAASAGGVCVIVGEGKDSIFGEGGLASTASSAVTGRPGVNSTGSSTIKDASPIPLREVEDGSGEMTIDGAGADDCSTTFSSTCAGSSVMECALRKGEDKGERDGESVYAPDFDTSVPLTVRRPIPITASEFRREATELSVLVGEDSERSIIGGDEGSEGALLPFNIFILR